MLKFCEFPNINGLVSLCTGELVSVVSNIYLVVITIVAIILVRVQKTCNSRRWSCHTLIWVLIVLNCISILLYSTAWLLIVKTEAVVVYQILNILAFLCLPLSFNIFEQKFHPKFNIALTSYCLLSGVSKMLVVTSFSRSMVTWSWISGVDIRFLCAIVQAIVLLLLTFITFYNFWRHLRKDFSELPSDDNTKKPLRCLSKALYLWCWKLLLKARNKTLQLNDCFLLSNDDCSTFEKSASSLLLLILYEHCKSLLLSGLMYLVVLVLEFVPIYITFCLLHNFASPNSSNANEELFSIQDVSKNNYSLIVLLFLSETLKCVLHQGNSFISAEVAAKSQQSLQELLYTKLMKIAQWELNESLVDIVTLQVDHVTTGLQMIHNVWKIPLQFTMCLIFMEMLIGLSALLPMIVLILCLLLMSWLLHKRSVLESKLQTSKQSWYYLVQEFIEHIWILKIRNIHSLFKKKILAETKKIPEKKVTLLFTLIQIIKHGLPSLLLLLMFLLLHVVDGARPLSIPAGVGAVLLLNMVRIQLSTAQTFCKQILLMAEALADISNTLAKDEIEEPNTNIYQDVEIVGEPSSSAQEEEIVAKICNGTFTWGTERMSPKVLSDINIKIPKGKLTIIIGSPGSGKTSLLSALLGEMHNMVGEVVWAPEFETAVAAQRPLIFGGTVKENVLFGSKYDAERYLKIITLCNLKEHTLNIQESKSNSYHPISLARALYSSSPVLFLDTPLAGLDTLSREQFFFESVVLFAAEEQRTVIMTTDNPELVEHAYQVILLKQGKVVYSGPPSELNRDCDSFLDLLASHNKSLPPPVPVRRRLDKGRVTDPADEINVKSIPTSTYKEWIQSCNTVKLTLLLLSLFFTTFLGAITYWLLLRWISSYQPATVVLPVDSETIAYITNNVTYSSNESSSNTEATQFFIAGGALVLVEIVTVVLVNIAVSSACNTQLNDMLHSVAAMTLYHYNKTTLPSVLGRFTVDLELIGRPLMDCLAAVLFLSLQILGALIVQVIVSPGAIVVIVPMTLVTVLCYVFYKPCCRVVRILHADYRQNVYQHISETVSCLTLVRGFSEQDSYTELLNTQTRNLYSVNIVWAGIQRWLSLYQDTCVNILVMGCFIATTFVSSKINLELLALALLLLLLSTQHSRLLWNLLDSCDVILTSIDNCASLAYHSPHETDSPNFKPPAQHWPPRGGITFQDVFASMSADQEPQLRNITFSVEPGTKIGVGSSQNGGKNFIVPLIFRSLHVHNGDIKIDDCHTKSLSLEDLRKSIGFVPTDPPVFKGTIRYNLDPNEKYSDEELWEALSKVSLKNLISDLPGGLQSDDVYNFDREARRLLYLAMMLLNRFNIIVVEEPKIISNTELLNAFTKVLDEDLSNTTRIVIGQRSDTLLSCEQVLLLNQGRIASLGTKSELEEGGCPHYGTLRRSSRLVSAS
ncbi:hypothetical protein ACHWQZ_G006296 [Mnemiopsis leidyi]